MPCFLLVAFCGSLDCKPSLKLCIFRAGRVGRDLSHYCDVKHDASGMFLTPFRVEGRIQKKQAAFEQHWCVAYSVTCSAGTEVSALCTVWAHANIPLARLKSYTNVALDLRRLLCHHHGSFAAAAETKCEGSHIPQFKCCPWPMTTT